MIKILHSADWHLDTPFQGRSEEQARSLRRSLLQIPGRIAELCRVTQCDMMLLSGDIFDGPYTAQSLQALRCALEEAAVPVFITPGNHDFTGPDTPWLTESWPENVHIFTTSNMEAVELPDLNCRVWGAGFQSMDSESLLEGFHAPEDMINIGILHGDPTQASSPCCPVTQSQVAASGLAYLALGHIHKGGSFTAGSTLCAWPGCPMGRGYDEQGEKGVYITTITDSAQLQFYPLPTPRFYDWEVTAGGSAEKALEALLPGVGNDHFYRITFIGESEKLDLSSLQETFSQFPNLVLRDKTVLPPDIWRSLGEDSFDGTFFSILRDSMENADEATQQKILLSARICRQLLDGQEVTLP